MADSPRNRYSRSPYEAHRSGSRSRSRSRSRPKDYRARSRSRGRSEEINPGNTLYVTGLSTRVSERELDDYFSKEGKVSSCFLVVEPRTNISRGFAFITMETTKDANRCLKHLNQTVLDGRCITVEKSRRKRPRTPTPGRYLGLSKNRDNGGYGRDYGGRDDYGYRRSPPRRSSYQDGHGHGHGRGRGRDYSPRWSPLYEGGGGGDGYLPRQLPFYEDGVYGYSPRRSPPPYYCRSGYPPRGPLSGGRHDYSPRPSYGGRSRRDRSCSFPYSPYGR